MPFSVPGAATILPVAISTYDARYSAMGAIVAAVGGVNNCVPVANRLNYTPIEIPAACIIRKIGLANSGIVSGNICVSIYDATGVDRTPGNRLVTSGSVVHAGASTLQRIDIADTVLARGLHYIGFSADSILPRVTGFIPGSEYQLNLGIFAEAAAFAAPAVATPIAPTITDYGVWLTLFTTTLI